MIELKDQRRHQSTGIQVVSEDLKTLGLESSLKD